MKKKNVCNHCGWFLGIIGVFCFCFVAIFGAKEMLRSTEPESAQYKEIIEVLFKAADSDAVESKIKDVIATVFKEANQKDLLP